MVLNMKQEKVKQKRWRSVLGWIFGVIFGLSALSSLITVQIIPALILFVIMAILIPPLSNFIKNKLKLNLSLWLKIVIIVIGLIIIGIISDTNTVEPKDQEIDSQNDQLPSVQNTGDTINVNTPDPEESKAVTGTKIGNNVCTAKGNLCQDIKKTYSYVCSNELELDATFKDGKQLAKEAMPQYCNALKNGNINNCLSENLLTLSQYFGQNYQEECITNIAILKMDISICENIKDLTLKFKCFNQLAIAEDDISICKEKPVGTTHKESCYFSFAKTLGKIEICDEFFSKETNENMWISCSAEVAKTSLNMDYCARLEENKEYTYSKYNCENQIITETLDPEVCHKVTYFTQDECFETIAGIKQDISICQMMSEMSGWCYQFKEE